jgi:hypothetical protein
VYIEEEEPTAVETGSTRLQLFQSSERANCKGYAQCQLQEAPLISLVWDTWTKVLKFGFHNEVRFVLQAGSHSSYAYEQDPYHIYRVF